MAKQINTLQQAHRHVLRSGQAILAYDPDKNPCSLQDAMAWLEKIAMLYIDYQLLIAHKRALISSYSQTRATAKTATEGLKPRRQPRLRK